jgi:NAD(P)-dependent dehydrogenase (short-subunit alcohol dehydrogenase family)
VGKCNSKMGIIAPKQKALLMVGASGGVGTALLEYISTHTDLVCVPTYNKKVPATDSFPWIQYDSNDFCSTRSMFEGISNIYDIAVVIDVSGAFFASKLKKAGTEEIIQVISTNLTAPLILAKNAQEFMNAGGKIIFMSSIVSTMQIGGSSAYAASKAGLESGILALSSEYRQTGHAICGIRLGYMDYGMTYKIKEEVREKILDGKHGKKFINIEILGQKILDLLRSEIDEINGVLYEIK